MILDVYDNQPVLRYSLRYRNLTGAPQYVTSVDLLPFAFADNGQRYQSKIYSPRFLKDLGLPQPPWIPL